MSEKSEKIEMPLWNAMLLYAYVDDKKLKRVLLRGIKKTFEVIEE